MASRHKLSKYDEKRRFDKTPEPRGGARKQGGRRFVIQKHDARRLHYDFRLEIDGVLVSWAVPKGPSMDPSDKRLAVQTEDHPLDYADFEGVIPKGEYGGGTVMVWDYGTYRNLRANKGKNSASMEDSLAQGLVEVWLEGEKLQGGYALRRTSANDGKAQWLLIKKRDDEADARRVPTNTETASALSGRSMDEIAQQEGSDE